MINKILFEKIKSKYGDVASFAVWTDAGEKPKSNMADMSIFDLEKNPKLLSTLETNIIMVALNFSRPVHPIGPFENSHDSNSGANDFKIRYAFKDTFYYGAYMTDIIKNFVMVDSQDVKSYLKINPKFAEENVSVFKQEMLDIEQIGRSSWLLELTLTTYLKNT